ncbi:MAG TPA: radical SAM protein, partial [Dehalococcoidia bacterium]|nr:radical SAM protein [Dehalococcoidia bacterium]
MIPHTSSVLTPPPLPTQLYLEVVNRCNSLCTTCPLTFGPHESAHSLRWDEFLQITDQFPALERVVLHGIGEPLMNPELPRMIRHLKERGAYVLFNSNAILLNGRRVDALIESGLDEIRVSIDGATPETYFKLRGVKAFPKVLGNIRRFVERQRALGTDRPRVSFWMTGTRENIAELPFLINVA